MRYFAELSYQGTRYFGWQIQPGQISVQETLEQAFSTILGVPIAMTGCGRTDTGVHARQYFAHFDCEKALPDAFERRLNKFLPPDIAIHRITAVHPDPMPALMLTSAATNTTLASAKCLLNKIPAIGMAMPTRPDRDLVQAAAALLTDYAEFFPFCKSEGAAKTMRCELTRATWIFDDEADQWVFHITANRFLRGMGATDCGYMPQCGSRKNHPRRSPPCVRHPNPAEKKPERAAAGAFSYGGALSVFFHPTTS